MHRCLTNLCTILLFKGEMKEILLDAQELLVKWEKANPPRRFLKLFNKPADRKILLLVH